MLFPRTDRCPHGAPLWRVAGLVLIALGGLGGCAAPPPSALAAITAFQARAVLSCLYGVSLEPRGVDPQTGAYHVYRIYVALSDTELLSLPALDSTASDGDIAHHRFYPNMAVYARRAGIPNTRAYREAEAFCLNVVHTYRRTGAVAFHSQPRARRTLVFDVGPSQQVVFAADTADAPNAYWRRFFRTGNRLDNQWYYRIQ